ncbi:hypothetical protein HZS_4751, partial [Henneguya salminicola]
MFLVDKDLKLPLDIFPSKYDLDLDFSGSSSHFDGKINIEIEVYKATKTIILNASKLNIKNISITEKNAKNLYTITNSTTCENNETIVIEIEQELRLTRFQLSILFQGSLKAASNGLIQTDSNIITYFKPGYAHYIFPCWSELPFRAPINLSVKVRALSTHRDSTVLYNKDLNSHIFKRQIALDVCNKYFVMLGHQVAQLWVGHLITMVSKKKTI